MISSTANAASTKPNTPPLGPNAGSGGPSAAGLAGAAFARLLSDQAAPVPVPPAASTPSTTPTAAAPAPAHTAAPAPTPAPGETAVQVAQRKAAAASGAKPAASTATSNTSKAPDAAASNAPRKELVPPGEAADDTATDLLAGTDTPAADATDAQADASLAEITQLIGLNPAHATPTPPVATPLQDPGIAAAALAQRGDALGTEPNPTAGVAASTTAVMNDRASATTRRDYESADTAAGDADSAGAASVARTDVAAAAQAGRTDSRHAARADGRADTAKQAAAVSTAAQQDRAAAVDALSRPTSAAPTPSAEGNAANPAAFATLMQQSLGATTAGALAEARSPATDRVHASLHSTAFAPELATRVSLMAVDGVQQAELQLNPAEMGPVTVQIVVDGSQAQVSFQAAQADTRQALEQSLPDLAAALQGQGLTLSGGGVFQQAPQDRGAQNTANGDTRDGATTGRSGSGGSAASAAVTNTPAPRRTVGLLDTFA